ncbi:protein PHYTOCHROME KINASE SUBSTRATE 4-like [Chenopodium quinoa]|uniref:protein PHYTOCHROME KINASE SUBSTRATE 4-like n=1 Tax=Chenopodium quinoa TaxID=63459 RepID=UPI000B76D01C|nr:protein PHYTOCHROME KINASE SUBSTRATE 4-like [Chenopodium quinoa]
MDQFHDLKQQQNIPKPKFDIIDPSIVRAQFISKKDVSFSSYLHQTQNHQNKYIPPQTGQVRAEDSDQISIFDAAKYFSGLHDDQKEDKNSKGGLDHLASIPSRFSSVSSSIDDNGSNYGGRNSNSNYRARSFHATPTASSEASWNSQTGLLANPPGSTGVCLTKNLSPNSSTTSTSNATPRWPRISTKWLIPRRKCPCSGKKSVQVEERIESNTPRMVDLRRSTSSNGSSTNYISSSWYSPRQNSPKKGGTYKSKPLTPSNVTIPPVQDLKNNSNGINHHHHNHHTKNGYTSNISNPNKVVSMGPLKSFANHSEMIGTTATTVITNNVAAAKAAAVVGGTTGCNTNGFTFPILENPPVGVKKMFNVIAEPPRESLEVYQPRSHSSPKSRRTSYEDDNVLSDGSSDLFEIESFTTTSYPCRDSMDDVVVPVSSFNTSTMKRLGIVCRSNLNNINHLDENEGLDEPMTPSIAPTECYAPSEVSIDWSVTTAEGYDRASLSNFSVSASEIGLYAAMRRESERNNGDGGGGVSELLHPVNTQIVYTYSSSVAAPISSDLQKKMKREKEIIRVEIKQKQFKDGDNHSNDDDLPHLRIDSELVWP